MADKTRISSQDFKEPFRAGRDVLINPEIRASTLAFVIDRADYLVLTKFTLNYSEWGARLLILTIGLLLSLVAKVVAAYVQGVPNDIQMWEFVMVLLALISAVACYVVEKLRPNERTKLIKKMQTHFDSATTRVESHRQ